MPITYESGGHRPAEFCDGEGQLPLIHSNTVVFNRQDKTCARTCPRRNTNRSVSDRLIGIGEYIEKHLA